MIGFLLFLQAPQAVSPPQVTFYHETITLRPGGGRTVVLEARLRGPGSVSLPLASSPPDSAPFTRSPDVEVVLVRGSGTPRVEIRSTLSEATVRMSFSDNPGPELRYRLVNGTETAIDTFRLDVALPPGAVPSDVRYNVPVADSGPGRRVLQLERAAEGHSVRLNVGALAAGDIVELSLTTGPERKSPLPLVAGALASLFFLVRRRGSLRPPA